MSVSQQDQIKDTRIPGDQTGAPEKRNAFTELLSSKAKQPKTKHGRPAQGNVPKSSKASFPGRDGLGAYIAKPESYPPNVVVYHNEDFVAIHDLFPKSSLHLLLLPRDMNKTHFHPFEAFEDADFLAKVKTETDKLRTLAAGELRRKYGKESAQEKTRSAALNADPPPDTLPPGRDWEKEIMCGVHAVPSMGHLHVHVISVDRYSERLKHQKHYNSFSTPFFVPLEAFPLDPDDERRHPSDQGYLKRPYICWRCGRGFDNGFTALKRHLEQEFEEWKRL
ncbi:hypothetical protein N7492_006272 [Penicillium capsulatum]|uniref:Aprataxin-like protein n=1 Tax=Penicillium capsulatum TaxID=69766 RepID=A0A9W9I2L2_9EURO|nr:hypothetical protein N7492_006272 [Penicillium capsulatum]KAJ6108923.1 hypothetical protein N7512_008760 [Penicillium capsulatum]